MRRLLAAIRALFGRTRLEHDLDDELRAYLMVAADAHREQGLDDDDAARKARVALGSLAAVKETVRDVGWESRIERVWRDVRLACRSLGRAPALTAAAVLTLALGIGVNSTIFSLIDALVFRPLPVASPERLFLVSTRDAVQQGYPGGFPYALWDQIRRQHDLFESAAAWTALPQRLDLSQRGERQPVEGLFVSGNFFDVLGVRVQAGRAFRPEEDVPGRGTDAVAVISDTFWRRRYAGAQVLGTTLMVNRTPVTIVGIAPPGFFGPEVGRSFDIALPIGVAPRVLHAPDWAGPAGRSYLAVMLRTRPDVSADAIAGALRARQRRLVEGAMPPKTYWGEAQDAAMNDPFAVVPAWTGTSQLRSQYSRSLVLLFAIATLVLIIACVNVANLLLARTASHEHEFSVRLALGAPRRRIVQQQFIATLILAFAGTAAAVGIAMWCSRLLVGQLSTWSDRIALDVSPDWRFIVFAAAACLGTAMLAGAVPALRAARVGVTAAAGRSRPGTAAGRRLPMRSGVVIQVALSVVMLVAATLLVRSFQRLGNVRLGFDSTGLVIASVDASRAAMDRDGNRRLWPQLADRIRAVPGVVDAAVSLNTPLNHGITFVGDFARRDRNGPAAAQRRTIVNFVTPGWFETYRMTLRAGRTLGNRDVRGAPAVVVVNEALAHAFFPHGGALGATLVNPGLEGSEWAQPVTIVGIVANAVDQSLRSDPFPTLYQPIAQFSMPLPLRDFSISVRLQPGAPAEVTRAIGAALTSANTDLTFSFERLADQVAAARHQERLVAWLSGGFGVLALALAIIGVYGVTAYAVACRRTELGIRMALGAQPREVVTAALRDTTAMVAVGVLAGIALAAGAARYLRGELFEIAPTDPWTFVTVPAALAAIALLACYLPARRAASINPMETLRCE